MQSEKVVTVDTLFILDHPYMLRSYSFVICRMLWEGILFFDNMGKGRSAGFGDMHKENQSIIPALDQTDRSSKGEYTMHGCLPSILASSVVPLRIQPN
jgi:hypothetical protein